MCLEKAHTIANKVEKMLLGLVPGLLPRALPLPSVAGQHPSHPPLRPTRSSEKLSLSLPVVQPQVGWPSPILWMALLLFPNSREEILCDLFPFFTHKQMSGLQITASRSEGPSEGFPRSSTHSLRASPHCESPRCPEGKGGQMPPVLDFWIRCMERDRLLDR